MINKFGAFIAATLGTLAFAIVLVGPAQPAAASAALGNTAPRPAPTAGRVTAASPPALDLALRNIAAGRLVLRQGSSGIGVMFVQSRLTAAGLPLPANGWFGPSTVFAVRHLQEKYFLPQTGRVDSRTLAILRYITAGRMTLPSACRVGRIICVDKTQRMLRLVVNGRIQMYLDARFGRPGLDTREGYFSVFWKSRNHVSSIYGSWMPYALFFSGGQAIHFSPAFTAEGYYGGSHGCINLRDWRGAGVLFDSVPVGTPVYVYR